MSIPEYCIRYTRYILRLLCRININANKNNNYNDLLPDLF